MQKAAKVLCSLSDLPDGASRGFSLGQLPDLLELFLVRDGGQVLGYVNRCPHTGVGLEWQPDRFLDSEGQHIQCHTHGALFRIRDGYCVSGPCSGQSLQSLPIHVDGGKVHLGSDAD